MKKAFLFLFGGLVALLLVIRLFLPFISYSPGYYFARCSCSYEFHLREPRDDCLRICTNNNPLNSFQKLVNLYFGTPK